MAATVAGVLLSVTGAAWAQATPTAAADQYDPQMLKALAGSLGVSEQAAARQLDRQAEQQATFESLREDGVKVDGAWFDAKGTLVVNAPDRAATKKVEEAGLTARSADHGEAALEKIRAALDKRAAKQVPEGVTSWSTDLDEDAVTIRVNDAKAPGARAFLKAAAEHGDAVKVVQEKEQLELQANVAPGSKMTYGGKPGYCSVGFGARDSAGRQYLATAGHCVKPGDRLLYDNAQFATGDHTRFHLGANSVDMGVAAINSGNTIGTTVGTWGQAADVAVHGGQRALPGAAVCKSGATTGWTCGTIQQYNVTVTYTDPGGGPQTVVTGLGRSSVCTEGGDSGGAYISGNQAQGMTSGGPMNQRCTGGVNGQGSSYFQPLDDTLRYYGLTLNTV